MVETICSGCFSCGSWAMVILWHLPLSFHRSLCQLSELSCDHVPWPAPHNVLGILAHSSPIGVDLRQGFLQLVLPGRSGQSASRHDGVSKAARPECLYEICPLLEIHWVGDSTLCLVALESAANGRADSNRGFPRVVCVYVQECNSSLAVPINIRFGNCRAGIIAGQCMVPVRLPRGRPVGNYKIGFAFQSI
jgi:hypothetical protein